MQFLTKIFGTRNDKVLKQLKPTVLRINELEAKVKPLSDEALRGKTKEFKERISRGESLDGILPEAFAVCREAGFRALNQRHFDVQLMGGIVLFQGKIAEMRTGEGKTLTATLPTYLHALAGAGAHVVTVNDYLAKRDSEWMAAVYNFLGMEVGAIVHGLSDKERRSIYASDITYGTNNEFGFDYLRDNMKTDASRLVQRGHNFAIVDEVDSILIDEARTPLIISGPSETNITFYEKVAAVIPGIQKDSDYVVDEKSRTVSLTEDGITKMERRLRINNIYDPANIEWLHHIQQALKAHVLFKKDVDYVVRGGEIIIVDEFTGRLMPGRRYSDGLHGALEAKENVRVQQETQTLATITFQNYFRLYKTLSGMTGTADTEAVEFHKIYKLDCVVIPTNRQLVRKDDEDMIYRSAREKYTAMAKEIQEAQKRGQPVLVGTVSVERSELLSTLLTKMNVPHNVLNAKQHEKEAVIIQEAGNAGHVTIATNMAGRGTDIKLGPGVKEAGGLYVVGTERHESRRIDNQLRGRSGRQGDPGRSRFFLSLEDDLMRIFASDRLSAIMGRLGMEEGEAIVSPMVTRAIEKAQRRVEEQNFSSRKNLLEYDDVMNQQRQVIYGRRYDALMHQSDLNFFKPSIEGVIATIAEKFSPQVLNQDRWDLSAAAADIKREMGYDVVLNKLDPLETNVDAIIQEASEQIFEQFERKRAKYGAENMKRIESYIYLQILDQNWKDHLLSMDALKDSVSLRGYGQRDPLQEYKREAFNLFSSLVQRIEDEVTLTLVRMPEPEAAMTESIVEPELAEPEEKDLQFIHPAEPTPVAPSESRDSQASRDDGLVYHASASQPAAQAAVQQTFRRDGDKVGRNDPCPCGSGKKYKKCHGLSSDVHA